MSKRNTTRRQSNLTATQKALENVARLQTTVRACRAGVEAGERAFLQLMGDAKDSTDAHFKLGEACDRVVEDFLLRGEAARAELVDALEHMARLARVPSLPEYAVELLEAAGRDAVPDEREVEGKRIPGESAAATVRRLLTPRARRMSTSRRAEA